MKIFITGAVDYIGGSIAERLRSDGHTVRGLVRRDTQAEGSTARSITPVLGDLDDHALLIRAARLADAVINAASSDQTILAAANEGVVRIVGAGVNRWSNVHIGDVTALYRLALERAPAGAFYFAGNGAAIARRLGLGPAQAWSVDEAAAVWGERAARYSFGSNSRVRGLRARRELGWAPSHGSITDWIERELMMG